jgi:hypothetical protein
MSGIRFNIETQEDADSESVRKPAKSRFSLIIRVGFVVTLLFGAIYFKAKFETQSAPEIYVDDKVLMERYDAYYKACVTPPSASVSRGPACPVPGKLPAPETVGTRLDQIAFQLNNHDRARAAANARALLMQFGADSRNPLVPALQKVRAP